MYGHRLKKCPCSILINKYHSLITWAAANKWAYKQSKQACDWPTIVFFDDNASNLAILRTIVILDASYLRRTCNIIWVYVCSRSPNQNILYWNRINYLHIVICLVRMNGLHEERAYKYLLSFVAARRSNMHTRFTKIYGKTE